MNGHKHDAADNHKVIKFGNKYSLHLVKGSEVHATNISLDICMTAKFFLQL